MRRVIEHSFEESASPAKHEVTVGLGEDANNLDFGSRYAGLSWHYLSRPTNVDGMNGTTPIDALLVINELDEHRYSDPDDGILPPQMIPLNPPRFLDVNVNNLVDPADALLVINELPSSAPAAALSSSATDPQPPSVGVLPPNLDQSEPSPNRPGTSPQGRPATAGSRGNRPAGRGSYPIGPAGSGLAG